MYCLFKTCSIHFSNSHNTFSFSFWGTQLTTSQLFLNWVPSFYPHILPRPHLDQSAYLSFRNCKCHCFSISCFVPNWMTVSGFLSIIVAGRTFLKNWVITVIEHQYWLLSWTFSLFFYTSIVSHHRRSPGIEYSCKGKVASVVWF